MILIVSGTNRPESKTAMLAKEYMHILESKGAVVNLMNLVDLPKDVAFSQLYGERTPAYEQDFVEIVEKAEKFVFLMPEYNGGFPGILKLFTDSIPPAAFHGKKAGLIGLSSGHAGAARAMDQFSNLLNYLKVDVISQKPKLSGIDKAMDEKGKLQNERYRESLETHAEHILRF